MAGKTRIGIVGMGKIGTVHARAFGGVPGVEVAALCDTRADVLQAKGEEFSVGAQFDDYRTMLRQAEVDAVVVCTPNFTHCRTTIDALKAGKHVLCEKPMALNAREGARMVAAAAKARKVLQMGMVWRHKPDAKAAREYVEQGSLGRVYHMRLVLRRRRGIPGLGGWFTTRALSGGGVLIDIGVHFLDLCMWLAEAWEPERVSAVLHAEFGTPMRDYVFTGMWAGPPRYDGTFDVDDYATGMVRFPGKLTLSFDLAWAANCEEGNVVEILGRKGGLRLADGNGLTLFTEHNGHIADIRPQLPAGDNFSDQARTFVRAIRGKAKCTATGAQGAAVMRLLDAIHRSSELGREVRVPRS